MYVYNVYVRKINSFLNTIKKSNHPRYTYKRIIAAVIELIKDLVFSLQISIQKSL